MVSGSDSEGRKRGRPRKNPPKTHDFGMRFSDEEYASLTMMAEKTGLTKTEIIRKALGMYENFVRVRY